MASNLISPNFQAALLLLQKPNSSSDSSLSSAKSTKRRSAKKKRKRPESNSKTSLPTPPVPTTDPSAALVAPLRRKRKKPVKKDEVSNPSRKKSKKKGLLSEQKDDRQSKLDLVNSKLKDKISVKSKAEKEKEEQAFIDELVDTKFTLKKGTFSKTEQKTLREAFLRAVESRGIQPQDVCTIDIKSRNIGRKLLLEVWKEVQAALPSRDRWAIYQHVRRKFTPAIQGRWYKEEEDALRTMVLEVGNKWQQIGKVLGRTGRNVEAKYKDMLRPRKGRWTQEEDDLLIKVIQELHPGPGPPQNNIKWGAIAERLQRPVKSCRERYFSTLYSRLVTGLERNPFTDDDDQELLRKIYEQGAEDSSEINWDFIATPKFPALKCRKRFSLLIRHVPGYHSKSLDENLGILNAMYRAKNDELVHEQGMDPARKTALDEAVAQLKLESTRKASRKTRSNAKRAEQAREECLIM